MPACYSCEEWTRQQGRKSVLDQEERKGWETSWQGQGGHTASSPAEQGRGNINKRLTSHVVEKGQADHGRSVQEPQNNPTPETQPWPETVTPHHTSSFSSSSVSGVRNRRKGWWSVRRIGHILLPGYRQAASASGEARSFTSNSEDWAPTTGHFCIS